MKKLTEQEQIKRTERIHKKKGVKCIHVPIAEVELRPVGQSKTFDANVLNFRSEKHNSEIWACIEYDLNLPSILKDVPYATFFLVNSWWQNAPRENEQAYCSLCNKPIKETDSRDFEYTSYVLSDKEVMALLGMTPSKFSELLNDLTEEYFKGWEND